jgi:hypothetical protein
MTFQRHFAFKHPLFRKTKTSLGIEWQKSVYYLWWEFLRRHDGYRKTCENRGKGKYAKLYQDFGDVHASGFKKWWTEDDRGARIFAEPAIPRSVVRLTKDDLTTFCLEWDDENILVFAAPLFLPKQSIQKSIARLLKQYHPRKRGERTNKESRALYPITNQFNFDSLKLALDVYDLHQGNPTLKLWEIAQKRKFTSTLTENELALRGQMAAEATGKKNTMSVAVSRKLKHAKNVIDGVGKGVFPQYKL